METSRATYIVTLGPGGIMIPRHAGLRAVSVCAGGLRELAQNVGAIVSSSSAK